MIFLNPPRFLRRIRSALLRVFFMVFRSGLQFKLAIFRIYYFISSDPYSKFGGNSMNIILILVIGLTAGVLGGLVGIGGGIVIVPALIFFAGFSQKTAQGTTLTAMIPPIGIAAAYVYYKAGDVDFKSAGLLAVGFAAGGYFGASFAESIDSGLLGKTFGVILILIGVYVFYEHSK
ncbi:sulfite exporter TauE/SafE family protein [Leptospira adleri]|uniref:sulfite exporter TauE/SafE family protein n=1 Tax=Leptospira adleri TaxID=2023186 RepID=UPI0023EADB12|nr:sulfite exporter TauE/SafE family protein [Leptospira adleri]